MSTTPWNFSYGSPQYGLEEVIAGVRTSGGVYGDQISIASVQMLRVTPTVEEAEARGNNVTTATAGRQVNADVEVRMVGISYQWLSLFTGKAAQSGGSNPDRYVVQRVTNKKFPYIGMCGRSKSEETEGDTHLFLPKMKIRGSFEIRFELDTFTIPSVTFRAVADQHYADGDEQTFFYVIEHETQTPVVLPPVEV